MQSTIRKVVRNLRPSEWRKLWTALYGPRVVVASVPKAGTHLLMRVLQLFPLLRSAGMAFGEPDEKPEMLQRIARLGRGQFITTHYPLNDIQDIVDERGLRGVFLIRDPRDTCVSWYHYFLNETNHWCHDYFNHVLQDQASRLMAAITGLEGEPENDRPGLNSIDQHFRNLLDYLHDPRFLKVRFEDVVGSAGGGDDRRQREVISSLADHLGLKLRRRDVSHVMAHAFDRGAPTFRKGQIGSWRQEMLPEHKVAFKEIAGSLLVDLGYEASTDW